MKDWNELTYFAKHYRMRELIPKTEVCPICKEKKKLELLPIILQPLNFS